jgi:hypothetical protein
MAKEKGRGSLKPNVQLDSQFKHPEPTREGYVQGEADLEYGMVSGFRRGILQTGHRHKLTPLGRKVRG